MSLFPFFMDISGKEGLVIGGGKHALEKVQRLLPYTPKLCVIADRFEEEIKQIPDLELICRGFEETDLERYPAFVVVAGDDEEENHRIAELCREKRILVNVVDDQKYCDFIFPSLISKGNLTIGISTNGASPSTGVLIKRKIQEQIPDQIEEILDFLQAKRSIIAERFPDKKKRYTFYYELSGQCMEKECPLEEEEFIEMLEKRSN